MNILCRHGDGFSADIVQQRKPYELVIANILAGPLKEMVDDLKACVDEGGRVILSGILDEQGEGVLDVYREHGFSLLHEFHIEGWSTFILNS